MDVPETGAKVIVFVLAYNYMHPFHLIDHYYHCLCYFSFTCVS